MAIKRLCVVVLTHISLEGDRRAIGSSIVVGRMIFSIVGGLGFVGGQSHVFVWRLLVLLVLCRLRMRRMLV